MARMNVRNKFLRTVPLREESEGERAENGWLLRLPFIPLFSTLYCRRSQRRKPKNHRREPRSCTCRIVRDESSMTKASRRYIHGVCNNISRWEYKSGLLRAVVISRGRDARGEMVEIFRKIHTHTHTIMSFGAWTKAYERRLLIYSSFFISCPGHNRIAVYRAEEQ